MRTAVESYDVHEDNFVLEVQEEHFDEALTDQLMDNPRRKL